MGRVMRYLWTAPNTLLGCAVALLALRGGHLAIVSGVVEAHGPLLRWVLHHAIPLPGGAAAITLGHVVVGADAAALDATRSHERVHVRQYEQWGPVFILAYVAASLWMFAAGGRVYHDNRFERDARQKTGRS